VVAPIMSSALRFK